MLPLLPIFAAVKNWKAIGIGLAAVLVCGIIILGYHHYTTLVEENGILRENVATLNAAIATEKATNKATVAALARWKAAEKKAKADLEAYAKVVEAAKGVGRSIDELRSQMHSTEELAALSSVSRLIRMFACAADGREPCPGEPTGAEPVQPTPTH